MSSTHLITAPGTPPAEQALCALAQARAIGELCTIHLDGHRFTPALWVLVKLIETTTALVEALLSEGEPS